MVVTPDPRHIRPGQRCPVCGDDQTEHGHGIPAPPPRPYFRLPVFEPVRYRWQRLARRAGVSVARCHATLEDLRRWKASADAFLMDDLPPPVALAHDSVARWWARWLPWWPA
jgi:hypothetical protein